MGKQARYDEIMNEMKSTLVKVGWKKDFVEKGTPYLPISGWMGDNLLKKSDNMDWWKGMDVVYGKETIKVETVYDFLNTMCRVPERPSSAPMRMPISGIYKIKGVGDVLAGRVEQGIVKPGEEVIFLPTHTASNPCTGKVFTVEMHHSRVDAANPGDNVGLNIKGLDKNNMPRSGAGHSQRDQVRLLTHWLCALRSICVPYFQAQVEDGQGDRWQEDGRTSLLEVQRDGRVLLCTSAASGVRHLQEL